MSTPGIRYTVGSKTFTDAAKGFEAWEKGLLELKKELGDLTRPFDEISSQLLINIQQRFKDNTFGQAPFVSQTSRFTKHARRARGHNPQGSKLFASGTLAGSIKRSPSPTKSDLGGQREVFVLRMGTVGAPHAKRQILGGVWIVPVRQGPRGGKYLDVEKLTGSTMSGEQFWGERWGRISSYPESTTRVIIPPRNFLQLFDNDRQVISSTIQGWIQQVINR